MKNFTIYLMTAGIYALTMYGTYARGFNDGQTELLLKVLKKHYQIQDISKLISELEVYRNDSQTKP